MTPTNQDRTSPPSAEPSRVLAIDSHGALFDVKSGLAKSLTGAGIENAGVNAEKWVQHVQAAMQECNASGVFKPFPVLTAGALQELSGGWPAQSGAKVDELASAWRELDAFADVKPALQKCRDLGIPVWVVTNSDLNGINALLERNGLASLVDGIMTAEAVGRYKPAKELYLEAASAAGTLPFGMVMASALSFDVEGALEAGCRAAHIRRDPEKPEPQTSSPYWTVGDFQELIELLQPLFARPAGGGEVF